MLDGKKGELVAETATLESKVTSARNDGPSSEAVEDSVSILRSRAEGRTFPGTSWFDGKHLRYKYVIHSTFKCVYLEVQRQIDED